MNNLDHLVVIDTETSGTNPFEHEVLSIALSPLKKSIPKFEIYVRPKSINWTEYARQNFLNFQEKWNTLAKPPEIASQEVEDYIKKYFIDTPVILIGHNVGFDISFIRKLANSAGKEMIKGISHRSIDTHTILYYLYLTGKGPKESTSSDGAFKHFNIKLPPGQRHTAMGDALATERLFLKLISQVS